MDIWAWVRQTGIRLEEGGQQRLAHIIQELPGWVCANQHEKVDAAVPEGLSIARRLGENWVEIFLRHWNLQSHIVNRCDVKGHLHEAVSLVEYSSRDENKGCPQSTCAVQDLCMAYCQRDDRGFAAERLAVAEETLARIDVSWPCFECIVTEKATALIDANKAGEALTFVDECAAQVVSADPSCSAQAVAADARCEALLRLGRYDDALRAAAHMLNKTGGVRVDQSHALLRCRALLGAGRADEAGQLHPCYNSVVATSDDYEAWVEVVTTLVKRGVLAHSGALEQQIHSMFEQLATRDALGTAFRVGGHGARLALARRRPQAAARYLPALRCLASRLRHKHEATQVVAALAVEIELVPTDSRLQP